MYDPISTSNKKVVWNEVGNLIEDYTTESIFIRGDFNAIQNSKEKIGRLKNVMQAMINFQEWYDKDDLLEILSTNGV